MVLLLLFAFQVSAPVAQMAGLSVKYNVRIHSPTSTPYALTFLAGDSCTARSYAYPNHNARSYADSNPNIHYYADAIFVS